MGTRDSIPAAAESITECLSDYQKELLRERTALRRDLRKATDLKSAQPIQARLTEVETELKKLRVESAVEDYDLFELVS